MQTILHNAKLFASRKLKEVRKNRGLTQSELAEKIGCTFQQVQKYEKGINRISVPRLALICKVLDVKPEIFFATN